jgi:beta-lactamase class D
MRAMARLGFQDLWPEAFVVCPQGLPTVTPRDPDGQRPGWQTMPGANDDRDLKLVDAILKTLRDEKVDDRRLFATGHSNGGGFTYLLWAERGKELAAVAPVAAGASALRAAGLPDPLPALHIAGETDAIVRFAVQQRTMEAARRLNRCAPEGRTWAKAGDLVGTIYPSPDGAPFVSVVHPGGHTYPAVAPDLIVRFFKEVTQPPRWIDSPAVSALFKEAGVDGTFVLYDVAAGTLTGHDRARAGKRFVPASTFKIPNTLIGLATGAVKDVDEILPYKGPSPAFMKAWERDMGLREAIALSNLPIYQELARRIGLERMREQVARLDYGNKDVGDAVDGFWLKGPLQISAVEQARFLARLAQDALPFPPEAQKSVREIVRIDQGPGWSLHAKTGWQNAPGEGVGWWVGWVQKEGRTCAFALNMDMRSAADAPTRIALGRACLQALGVLDNRPAVPQDAPEPRR